MKDSRPLIVAFALFLIATPLIAQKSTKKPAAATLSPVADARGRAEKSKEYPDSVEFEKTFKELYPLVKSKGSVRDIAEKQVDRQLATMTKQGIDSAEVIKAAYAGLDERAGYKIYFDVYREKLTAKELKAYLAFIKTPEGKKVHDVIFELGRAHSELNSYITRTVTTNLTPLRTTMQEKMMKSQKEKEEQLKSDTTDAGKAYRRQMHLRDSIMKARGLSPGLSPGQ